MTFDPATHQRTKRRREMSKYEGPAAFSAGPSGFPRKISGSGQRDLRQPEVDAIPMRRGRPEPIGKDLPGRPSMVRYWDNDITVTNEWLTGDGFRYPIDEVRRLRIIRATGEGLTIRGAIAVAVVFAIVRLWERLDTDGWIGGLTLLVLATALLPLGRRREPHYYLMTAEVFGCTRLVTSDPDRHRLRDIVRAIRTAQSA